MSDHAPAEIPQEVRELLAVVLEAIGIPYAATVGDHQTYAKVLEDRAMYARVVLERVLDPAGPPVVLEWEIDWLRRQLAEHPPAGYRHWTGTPRAPGGRP